MTGNEKLCKIYFKKLFFQNVLAFIDLFIDTTIFVIPFTQIACDVVCVQYVQKQPTEVLFKKGVLKTFAKLTGKHLRWSSKFLRTPILKNICVRLLICNKILEKIRAVFRI